MFGASPAGAGAACPRLSFLDDATQRGWEAMFRDAAGGFGPGRAMSVDAAGAILARSGLPTPILAQIWDLANVSPSSQPGLTLPEFLLAMFLAKSAVGGHQPPQVLPDRIAAEVRAAIASISAPRASPSPQPPIQTLHRPQSIPSPSPATSWSIPLAQQAQFDSAYSSFDPNRTGHLPRSVALSAFAQSGLRMEIIEKIWDMVDVWGSGRIDKKGFSAGLMLVNRVVQGHELPRTLPIELLAFIRGTTVAALSTSTGPSSSPSPPMQRSTLGRPSSVSPAPTYAATPSRPTISNNESSDFSTRFPDLDDLLAGPSGARSSLTTPINSRTASFEVPLAPKPVESVRPVDNTSSFTRLSAAQPKERDDLDALYSSLVSLERRKASLSARVATQRAELASVSSLASTKRTQLTAALSEIDKELRTLRSQLEEETEDVQTRAARMLAERMAKMGIQGFSAPAATGDPEKAGKREAAEARIRDLEKARQNAVEVLNLFDGVKEVPAARLEDNAVGRPSLRAVEVKEYWEKKEWEIGRARIEGREDGEREESRGRAVSPVVNGKPAESAQTRNEPVREAKSTIRPINDDLNKTADFTANALAKVQAALADAQARQEQAMQRASAALETVKASRYGPSRDVPPPPKKKAPPPPVKPKPVLKVAKKPPPPPPPKKFKSELLDRPATPERPPLESPPPDSPPTPAEERLEMPIGETLELPGPAIHTIPIPAPKPDGVEDVSKVDELRAGVPSEVTPPSNEEPFNPFLQADLAVPATIATTGGPDDFWAEFDKPLTIPAELPVTSANPFDKPPALVLDAALEGRETGNKTEIPSSSPAANQTEKDEFAEFAASRASESAKNARELFQSPEAPRSPEKETAKRTASPTREAGSELLLNPPRTTLDEGKRRVSDDDWLMAPASEQIKPVVKPGTSPASTLPRFGVAGLGGQDKEQEKPSGIADRKKMLEGVFGGGLVPKATEPAPVSEPSKAATLPRAKKWPTVEVGQEDSVPKTEAAPPPSAAGPPPPPPPPPPPVVVAGIAPPQSSLRITPVVSVAPVREAVEDIFADDSETVSTPVPPWTAREEPQVASLPSPSVPEPAVVASNESIAEEELTILRYAFALYPFTKNQPDDLDFGEGAKIAIQREEGEWLYGRVVEGQGEHEEPGWFPASYVSDTPPPPPSEPDLATPTTPIAAIPDKPIAIAEAIYDYDATRDDELTVREGWILNVLTKSDDDDWWLAEHDGNRGLVPATYVQEITEAEAQARRARPGKLGHAKSMSVADGDFLGRSHAHRSSDPIGSMPRSPLNRSYTDMDLRGGAKRRTWAAEVDPAFLVQTTPEERKRQEAIFELIATEQHYVRDLQLILEVFYQPLQQFSSVSVHDLQGIFNNIDEILVCNSLILSDFEKLQTEQGGVIHAIGRAFLNHTRGLQAYERYCGTQMQSSKYLQKKRTEDKTVGEFLKRSQLHPKCRSLDLSSFLLEPFQRITRYPLLFRQILHYTPVDHPDHEAVMQALETCEDLLAKVNDMVREIDNREKVEEISGLVDLDGADEPINLFSPTKYVGPRMFIYEGQLAKAKSGRKLYAFLFNDLLLITQARSQAAKSIGMKSYSYTLYRKAIPLSECVAREIPPMSKPPFGVDDSCFQVIHGQEVITLRANSVSNKRTWLNHFETQCTAISAAVKKLQRQKSGATGLASNPLNAVGTLQITVLEAKDLVQPESSNRADIFVTAQVDRQSAKTRSIRDNLSPKFNQPLLLTVHSFDDPLRLTVYNFDKYSSDEFLGTCQVGLDMLERYGGRETDRMVMPLRGVPTGSLVITMQFRKS